MFSFFQVSVIHLLFTSNFWYDMKFISRNWISSSNFVYSATADQDYQQKNIGINIRYSTTCYCYQS